METYRIADIARESALKERAARWFSEKWRVPLSAYEESMDEMLRGEAPVPRWYAALEGERRAARRGGEAAGRKARQTAFSWARLSCQAF